MATYLGKAPARLAITTDDSITSAKIVDNTVTSADILNASITGADLATDIAITTSGNISTTGDLTVDTNTLYVDSTNNRVGIGTASPDVTLDVQPSVANSGIKIRRHNASGQYIEISETDGSRHEIKAIGDKEFRIFNEASSNSTTFYTNSTERVRIDQSGNVGIGTTSPSVALDVVGAITATGNITGTLATASQPNITSVGTLTSFTSTGIDDNATSTAISLNSNQQVILYGGQIQNTNNTSSITYSGGSNSNAGANLTLFGGSHATTPNVARFRSSATEVMRIDSSGRVGIGTSSPSRLLSLNAVNASMDFSNGTWLNEFINSAGQMEFRADHTNASASSVIKFSVDGSERMRIASNGDISFYEDTGTTPKMFWDASTERLGIGTSSPSSILHVNGNFTSTGIDDNATSTAITIDSSQNVTISGDTLTVGDGHTIGNDGTFDNLLIQSSTNENIEYNSGLGSHIFKQNGTEVFRINDTTGNVGIGTSSPAPAVGTDKVLEIAGSVSPGLVINDTGQAQKYQLYADSTKFKMVYGSTNFFTYNASNGNLGIGTTTPSYNFHIVDNVSGSLSGRIENTNSNGIAFFGARNSDGSGCNYGVGSTGYTAIPLFTNRGFISSQATTDGLVLNTEYTDPIIFGISNSEKMRIDSSGNIGIGTTSLGTYQLSVDSGTAGNTNAEAGIFAQGIRSGVVYNFVSNNTSVATGRGTGIKFQSGGFDLGAIVTRSDATAASGDAPGYMTFHTSSNNTESLSERMRIDSSGNVGINTSAPTAPLEVVGAVKINEANGTTNGVLIIDSLVNGNPQIRFYQNGSVKAYLNYLDASDTLALSDAGGNGLHFSPSTQRVGIGTSSPSQNLEIRTTTSDTGILVKSTGNTGNAFNFDANRTSALGSIGVIRGLWNGNGVSAITFNAGNDTTNKDDGIITFATRASGTGINPPERMRIDSSGNVGINTTHTDTKFSLEGSAKISVTAPSTNDDVNTTNKFELLKFSMPYAYNPPRIVNGNLILTVVNNRHTFNSGFGFKTTNIDFTLCAGQGLFSNGFEVLQAINTLSNSSVDATSSGGFLTALTVTAEVSFDGGTTFGTSFGVAQSSSTPTPIVRLVANVTRSSALNRRVLTLNYTANYSYNKSVIDLISDSITDVT